SREATASMTTPRTPPRTPAAALAVPILLLTLLLTLQLTACGSHSTHIADPPVSPPPSSSAPSDPPKRESPQHFIRRFVAASNSMEMLGDVGQFLALTSRCRPCN